MEKKEGERKGGVRGRKRTCNSTRRFLVSLQAQNRSAGVANSSEAE